MTTREHILSRALRARKNTGSRGAVVPCDRHRALVVDDEQSIVMIFQHQIEQELPDLHVDSASNGLAAVEAFSKGHHGILVMDLSMPIMDGRQAFEEIARMCEARGWEMPSVIFCTGFAPRDFLEKVVQGHPERQLLLKPVGGDAVVKAIEQRLPHRLS